MKSSFSKSTYLDQTQRYIISFFISAYNYSNILKIPKIKKLIFACSLFYVNSKYTFIKQLLFFLLTYCKFPFYIKKNKNSTSKEWILKFCYSNKNLFLYYEKFLFLIFPRFIVNPIVANFTSNDYFNFSVKGYSAPEEFLLLKRTLEYNIISNTELGWFFTPKKTLSVYEERNLLRLYNIPLLWKK